MTKSPVKLLVALCSILLCILVLFIGYTEWNDQSYIPFWRDDEVKEPAKPDEMDQCIFANFDPWDSELKAALGYLNYNSVANCDKNYKFRTELKNYTLLSNDTNCQGRCLYSNGDWNYTEGKWQPVGSLFECDVIQAVCDDNGTRYYNMLHAQIWELKKADLKPIKHKKEGEQYSVYVILMDSISTTQMMRVMPKTLTYLINNMSAVNFPHVNKVGENSGPNGQALWLGYRPEVVDRGLFRLPTLPAELDFKTRCKMNLDNETLLFKEYEDYGYKTMLAEDWLGGALQWPDCLGFRIQPTTHYMKPFQVMMDEDNSIRRFRNKYHCVENHKTLLQYMEDFMHAYKDSPKFAWLWLTDLGHDQPMEPAHADGDFLAFLEKNRETLDNAFTIFTADHGFRFGEVLNTKLGALEINNPMLTISVPKKLRNSKLRETLIENRMKLQTHYDTRATLLDILKYQPASNYQDDKPIQVKNEHGNSQFRKQDGPRSCKTLPIPLEYCICQFKTKELNLSSPIAKNMGRSSIQHINDILIKNNLSNVCVLHEFEKMVKITAYLPEESQKMYAVRVEASSPSSAQFQIMLHALNATNFEVVSSSVARVDQYGKSGECAGEAYKHLCFCKPTAKLRPPKTK